MDLNIARKKMLIYPASHEHVRRAVRHSGDGMRRALARISPLTIMVIQDGLGVGPQPLEPKNAIFKELAQVLKQRGIAAVTVYAGFDLRGWGAFLKLLTLDPEQIGQQGGIAAVAAQDALGGIRLHPLDYSKLQVTEEREIQRAPGASKSESIWRRFVSQMLSGKPVEEEDAGPRAADCTPADMAGMLNAEKLAPDQAIACYRTLIDTYLREAVEEKTATEVFHMGLESFGELVRELNPGLQHRFVTTALDLCAQSLSCGAQTVLRSMDADLIVCAMRLADAEGKEISPSLLAFIRKMGIFTDSPVQAAPEAPRHDRADDLQTLMAREAYETYVDDDYDRILTDLSSVSCDGALSDDLAALKRELENSLEETPIAVSVAQALKGLMDVSLDPEEYRDWARQLTFLLDELLSLGAYAILAETRDVILAEQQVQGASEKGRICDLVLDHFVAPSFLARVVEAAHRNAGRNGAEAIAFLEHMGEPAVAEILEYLGNEERFRPDDPLLHLLSRSARTAAEEALERLHDPRPHYVGRMLGIIRRCGSGGDAEGVKVLLDHPVDEVRMEALATLLNFNNAWGLLRLRELMTAPWSPAAHRAIRLAGEYRVREVLPSLMAFVERPGSLNADLERREAALRALGRIGDPQGLAALNRILRRRWSWSRKALSYLRSAAYESLEGYPYEAVKDLLHAGLRQKDPAVAAICERVMKKLHRTAPAARPDTDVASEPETDGLRP